MRAAAERHVVEDAVASRDQRVADSQSFHLCRACTNLRKHILRVFRGVGRQRTERLEFSDCGEPVDDPGPRPAAPGVDAHGDLGGPKPQRAEGREELITPAIEQLKKAGEPLDLRGRRVPVRFQRFYKLAQPRGLERMRLQPMQHLGEKNQVGRAALDGRKHGAYASEDHTGEDTIANENEEKRHKVELEEEPAHESGGPEHAENKRDKRHPESRKDPPGGSKFNERGRIDGLANIDAQQLEVFAQVELRAQLTNGLLALGDLLWARGGEQPGGQRVLTRSRPRGA